MSCTATALPCEQRADEAVLDEPGHVGAGPRVHQRRAGDPDDVAAALALVD
jgi:hypothetical protein